MGKTIRLNESELINIIKKIVLNSPVISEVKKIDDFDEYFPEYEYKSISVRPRKNNPNEIGVVFFNGPNFNQSEYRNPEENVTVTFTGDQGDFEFDSSIVKTNGGSPFVFGNNLNDRYYDKLLSLMKKTVDSTSNTDKPSSKFTGNEIRQALKIAFNDYWVDETPEFSGGLRDIETIGDYLKGMKDYDGDNTETWSIMNFFDTRNIPKLINQRWEQESEEYKGDKIDWLVNIFKNDKEFLNKLLKAQWPSIYSGFFKTEISAIKNLKKMFEDLNLDATFKSYPMGHKNDRNSGVDVEFTIKGKRPMGVQIKPASKIKYMEDGTIKVFTNNMTNDYKTKNNLDYILYDMGNTFYLFRNSDYMVVPNTNGGQVIHYKDPAKIYKG